MKLAVAATLAGLVLAGCETHDVSKFNAPETLEKYPVSEGASQDCIDSARRATRWCVTNTGVNSDTTWQRECMLAQWQYNSYCGGGGGPAKPYTF